MRNAVIFHGTGDDPKKNWYGWLGAQLKRAGFQVDIPNNPTINREPISEFLPKVLNKHTFNEETVLIGHSAGAPLILSILENIDIQIKQAVLVAGYCTHPDDQMEDPILQDKYDWDMIKRNVRDIIFINSVNDPWSCTDEQGRMMFDKLGGTQIIKNEGHFGSDYWKQEYPEFPLLEQLIIGGPDES